ncbi:small subunit ribosomal protein S20 [Alkalibacillus filiformis]|uniref:Small ribosomal subunit protein bS20 n=1 Tax=Alkalibacillus filiformis TaxID=200990 RepID=A0ABU0DRT2_9BACI|nr:30S ribosomal protein S20 [Alkalibacillus filiformis]MDQ0351080.1 small subunit ribosomal protein S20 [Alkalibacillus filiformis]
MANNPQAVKRIRVNQDKRERNQIVRSDMRSAVKSVETAVKQNDASAAQDLLKTAVSKIDKAVQRGIVHKNNGDRKKSSLTTKVNKIAN